MQPGSTLIRKRRPPDNHGREGHIRSAFALLLVLALMSLAVTLLYVITASTAQVAATCYSEHRAAVCRQMLDSGAAWATAHAGQTFPDNVVTLDAAALVPEGASGTITIEWSDSSKEILVTAALTMRHKHHIRQATYMP